MRVEDCLLVIITAIAMADIASHRANVTELRKRSLPLFIWDNFIKEMF
jgi:hypothetical protein